MIALFVNAWKNWRRNGDVSAFAALRCCFVAMAGG
jgi:hypothetical protein